MTNDKWGSEWPSEAPKPRSQWDKDVASVIARGDPSIKILKQDSGVTPEILGVRPKSIEPSNWTIKQTQNDWSVVIDKVSELDLSSGTHIKHMIAAGWGGAPSLQTELKSQGSNLVDDQAYLYFQCESCNEILDPHTKSFQTLQEFRVNAGWYVKWNLNGQGYKVYCAKCGGKA